ncbi:hypothetical protein AX17_007114 [Amanita inopinata Kibby_2008]|nr:hypothetical protein AX17_007114 [Amanita inopinata Kibby_2008]
MTSNGLTNLPGELDFNRYLSVIKLGFMLSAFTRGAGQAHQREQSNQDTQTHGMQSLPSDLSDPTNLISLILNGTPIDGTNSHDVSSRRRREREQAYSHLSSQELVNTLIDKEHEAKRLLKALRAALQRLNTQAARISELENNNQEALERLRQINQSRIEAQQEASRASQELQLYQIELENAQREVMHGSEMMTTIQKQRDDAEQAAIRARAKARRLRQQRLVDAAREEGRKWGFSDGFERAKQTYVINRALHDVSPNMHGTEDVAHTDTAGHQEASGDAGHGAEDDVSSVRSSTPEIIRQTEIRPPSPHDQSTPRHNHFSRLLDAVERPGPSHRASQSLPTTVVPQVPAPQTGPVSATNAPPPQQRTEPLQTNEPARSKSPSIQIFRVDFADAQEGLEQEYNIHDNFSTKLPRKSWVTAQQHKNHGQVPLPTHAGSGPSQAGPSRITPSAGVQVSPQDEKKKASWYRSFSFRKKFGKRPVIDPDPTEERPPTGKDETPVEDVDEEDMYRYQPDPSTSWYRRKGPSAFSARHRSNSLGSGSTSTHMSQLPLVNAPGVLGHDWNTSNTSLSARNGREPTVSWKFKDKENALSIIKEDPMSRGNTPTTDRILPSGKAKAHRISHVASSSTVNGHKGGGLMHSVQSVISESHHTQFPSVSQAAHSFDHLHVSKTGHRRTVSEGTPPTISVQAPSRSPSDTQRLQNDLQNQFLSPNLVSRSLPQPPSIHQNHTVGEASSSRGPEFSPNLNHKPSRRTSAMNIKENYLARAAEVESGGPRAKSPSGSSRLPNPSDPGRPSSRQGVPYPNNAGSTPMGLNTPLPGLSHPGPTLSRVQSNVSLRSVGSYGKYDPQTYADPAYFHPNADQWHGQREVPTRPTSSLSGISYVSERK